MHNQKCLPAMAMLIAGLLLSHGSTMAAPATTTGEPLHADTSLPDESAVPAYSYFNSGLVITSPAPGTMVAPGEILKVTIETTNGYTPEWIVVRTGFAVEILDSPPYELSIQVPHARIQSFDLYVAGMSPDAELSDAPRVPVTVGVTAGLTGTSASPTSLRR